MEAAKSKKGVVGSKGKKIPNMPKPRKRNPLTYKINLIKGD